MAGVTVEKLATVLGVSPERLLEQLAEAGMKFNSVQQEISATEKVALLEHLRSAHGKAKADLKAPSQITLKRKTVSELTVPTGGPGRGAKTVNVEVRQKKVYVKRSTVAEAAEHDPEREEAQRLLNESHLRRESEDMVRRDAEARRQADEEKQREIEERASATARKPSAVPPRKPNACARKKPSARPRKSASRPRPPSRRSRAGPRPTTSRVATSRTRTRPSARRSHAPSKTKWWWTKPSRWYRRPASCTSPTTRAARRRSRTSAMARRSRSAAAVATTAFSRPTAPVVREVEVGDTIIVADLAQKLAVKAPEVIKALMKMGVFVTINQSIDHDTAVLVSEELGHSVKKSGARDVEADILSHDPSAGDAQTRPPVVTIMGHVDHGKTSLLDHIRRTRVAAGEAGGITQHIGAYHVNTKKGIITFLDTPGHSAFTQMRARGAKITDIVILVVAADDGVMPQTIEAINHAKAAKVPIIVAVNKMDKADADPERVKQGLLQHELVPEEYGGDVQVIPLSAKSGMGIDNLLDAILVQSEVLELKAAAKGRARGTVVESTLDKGRGPVATVLVQSGLLKKGDIVLSGTQWGRVRAMFDEAGRQIAEAGPSIPAVVIGLQGTPNAGDDFLVVADERAARDAATARELRNRDVRLAKTSNKLDDIFAQMGQGEVQTLNLLVKADVQGSAEALRESLTRLATDQIKVNIIASGVGGITESDATLAVASKAIVIGFNVRADAQARKVLQEGGVEINYYSIIYEAIDHVRKALTGMLGTETREQIIGLAQVRDVFRSSKFGAVAGCMVIEGVVKRNKPIRVLRDNVVVFEGELESLRRFKDVVEDVRNGMECGIAVKAYNDVKVGDQIECFDRIEVQRTLTSS
jgi:translation initiation factor IF-2